MALLAGMFGQAADFVGDHAESLAGVPRVGGFDRGVHREQVGLRRDSADKLVRLHELPGFLGNLVNSFLTARDLGQPGFARRIQVANRGVHPLHVGAHAVDRTDHLLDRRGRLFDLHGLIRDDLIQGFDVAGNFRERGGNFLHAVGLLLDLVVDERDVLLGLDYRAARSFGVLFEGDAHLTQLAGVGLYARDDRLEVLAHVFHRAVGADDARFLERDAQVAIGDAAADRPDFGRLATQRAVDVVGDHHTQRQGRADGERRQHHDQRVGPSGRLLHRFDDTVAQLGSAGHDLRSVDLRFGQDRIEFTTLAAEQQRLGLVLVHCRQRCFDRCAGGFGAHRLQAFTEQCANVGDLVRPYRSQSLPLSGDNRELVLLGGDTQAVGGVARFLNQPHALHRGSLQVRGAPQRDFSRVRGILRRRDHVDQATDHLLGFPGK